MLASGNEVFGSARKSTPGTTVETGASALNNRAWDVAGTLSDLSAVLPVNSPGADVAFQRGGSDVLSITFGAGETGEKRDAVGSVALAALDDTVMDFTSAGTSTITHVGAVFDHSGSGVVAPVGASGSGHTDIGAGETRYVSPIGGRRASTTIAETEAVAPFDTTWSQSSIAVADNTLIGAGVAVVSMVNGSVGSQSGTIAAGGAQSWTLLSGSDALSAGDRFCYRFIGGQDSGLIQVERLISTIAHATQCPIVTGGQAQTIDDAQVKYFPLGGTLAGWTTQAGAEHSLGFACRIDALYLSLSRVDGSSSVHAELLIDGVAAGMEATATGVGVFVSSSASIVIPAGAAVCTRVTGSGARGYVQCLSYSAIEVA